MKKLNFKTRKNQKGITLIALVITIIVLLILAGVSIATLTGENGILTRANNAKKNTEQAEEDELRRLTALEAATNLKDTTYTDNSTGEEKTITIPAETAVSQVEGENTLKDGLVIIDKNGNEWVWIEVPKGVTEDATTDDEIENELIKYASKYRGDYTDTWYKGCGLEEQEYYSNYSKMLQSIKTNNGFWVGRYEVGSFDNPVKSKDNTRKPVIQQGAYPYNYIECQQAENLAEGLVIGEMTSTLMFGIQWDLVLAYLEKSGVPENDLKVNSGLWGNYRDIDFPVSEGNKYAIYSNYSLGEYFDVPKNYTKPSYSLEGNGVLLSTGATERNCKMNIYDLAGNVSEWILEKNESPDVPCARRGGCYRDNASNGPATRRDSSSTSNSSSTLGFRSTLY